MFIATRIVLATMTPRFRAGIDWLASRSNAAGARGIATARAMICA